MESDVDGGLRGGWHPLVRREIVRWGLEAPGSGMRVPIRRRRHGAVGSRLGD